MVKGAAWAAQLACVVSALALPAGRAAACASCACGDPTLTAMGSEKPFRHRVRLALEEQVGGRAQGEEEWAGQIISLRSALSASYSPTSFLTIGALLPVVGLFSRQPGRPLRSAGGLGDLEVMARALVVRDRRFSPRHLGGLLLGLKAPTGPRISDDAGYPLPDDDQPGSGSWDPFFGASYAWFGEPVAVFASASYRHTTTGRRDYRRGSSLGATAAVQYQVRASVALALSADLRWSAPDTLASGADAPNSGGVVLSLTPALLVQPATDWLVRLALQAPVVQLLAGAQTEYPMGVVAVVRDL